MHSFCCRSRGGDIRDDVCPDPGEFLLDTSFCLVSGLEGGGSPSFVVCETILLLRCDCRVQSKNSIWPFMVFLHLSGDTFDGLLVPHVWTPQIFPFSFCLVLKQKLMSETYINLFYLPNNIRFYYIFIGVYFIMFFNLLVRHFTSINPLSTFYNFVSTYLLLLS